MAEIHLRHVANFIIVVEHHPPVSGHAEVFKQHVTRENIGGSQLANSVTIFFYRIPQLLAFDLLQPDI
ncbi:hypothetical protein D3C81_2172520 [compost metagenome]